MKRSYKYVGSFKGGLFLLAIASVSGVFVYTNLIINELRESSRELLALQVDRLRVLITEGGDVSLDTYLAEMQTKDFPLIISDQNGMPLSWSGLELLDSMDFSEAQRNALKYIHKWNKQGNNPISFSLDEFGLTFNFHYGDTTQITRLRVLPMIGLPMIVILLLIGYFGFVNIKKSEQNSLWVGMSRETAHQLGTPLTSLLGWAEILRDSKSAPDIVSEIDHDLNRLKIVAERFHQIGSPAAVENYLIKPILEEAVQYIRRRLPQLASGEVNIGTNYADTLLVNVNPTLFEWVLENLIKNSIEALQGKGGNVLITAYSKGKKVIIDISDDGSGIPRSNWKDIFRPGVTTKKRGWGLGLSLARRIVEEVHRGKIFVAESKPYKATIIRVILNGNS